LLQALERAALRLFEKLGSDWRGLSAWSGSPGESVPPPVGGSPRPNSKRGGLAPVAIVALVALAAAVGSMPWTSPVRPTPTPTIVSSLTAADPTPSASAPGYLGDGSIPNVMQRPQVAMDARSLLRDYKIVPGDSLGRIANKFGLDVATVYWANQKALPNPQFLHPGQELVIPPFDGLLIKVGAHTTLQSIASRYGVSTQVIIDANDMVDPTLTLGQMILVPGAEAGAVPRLKVTSTTLASGGWNGKFAWPVPNHTDITQGFGCTGQPEEPRFGSCAHFHDAIDIGAPYGVPVVASTPGIVIYAGWKAVGSDGYGGGIVVWISHNGSIYTTYNHLSYESVSVGQRVVAGQQIGRIGATGNATGPHLHFEVWVCYPYSDGTTDCARNPLRYVRP
jgi:murein DD-endopeptidase MepM/ murein hydrolase activator NlpD